MVNGLFVDNLRSFVLPQHVPIFSQVARDNHCNILVRETGVQALSWIGQPGYTGKRADMKAKTAKGIDAPPYKVSGLVFSPELLPNMLAGSAERATATRGEWRKTLPLITIPDARGFDDHTTVRVPTPYILQTDRKHRHYGCVAWVERGLIHPRYIHGDYDLYAIVPAGRPFNVNAPGRLTSRFLDIGSSTGLPGAMRQARPIGTPPPHTAAHGPQLGLPTEDVSGPLSFRVATQLNTLLSARMPSLLGALMVNHGEQINLGGSKYVTHERVAAFLAFPRDGNLAQILDGQAAHEKFFAHA